MKIIKLTLANLEKIANSAQKALQAGNLIVIPSDTAYGLAARADSSKAVRKVLDFKGRLPDKGISVFLSGLAAVKKYAFISSGQLEVLRTLLPGAFTLILDSRRLLSSLLEPADKTLGVRVIKHEFVSQLLKKTGFPFTATSANLSGRGPHYSIPAFLKTLSDRKKKQLSLVIDAGRLPRRPVSTVIRLTSEKIKVIRPGLLNPRLVLNQRTKNPMATIKLAQKIYQDFLEKKLASRAVGVILRGGLGSGKTVFAQGIGRLFNRQLFSPTFVLMDEHPINRGNLRNIYHLDLYRLENPEEINDLDLTHFFQKGNLLLFEWGEKLASFGEFKKTGAAFYWLQIEAKGENIRDFKLYQL
ncbi:MAG: threonylcarbamoyl-AMP synthase [Candidatus Pacebacteria bacterium]|nr:threonylcarbamoyl-AMP synthase [Candidatus Paceibacterota bacterium]